MLVWVADGGEDSPKTCRFLTGYAAVLRPYVVDVLVKNWAAKYSERFVVPEFFGWKMAARKTALKKAKSRSTSSGKGSRKTSRKAHTQKRLTAGEWFERLVTLQARLRSPNGCPWDREQTHATLRTYLIEEAYEVLDAMKSGDDAKFANEMGDLLLQVVFHSQIATEEGRFTVADVIREVHEKMVRRHPHVFGEKRAKDAAEVLRNWEQIKAQERQGAEEQQGNVAAKAEEKPKSLLDGVPRGLPATMEGLQLTRKASRAGFDWDHAAGVFEKLSEECAELRHASETKDAARMEEEMGDLLFAAVNLARFLQVDPEIALKNANAKFARRFREMERLSAEKGQSFTEVPRADKEKLWEAAKHSEGQPVTSEVAGSDETHTEDPPSKIRGWGTERESEDPPSKTEGGALDVATRRRHHD